MLRDFPALGTTSADDVTAITGYTMMLRHSISLPRQCVY